MPRATVLQDQPAVAGDMESDRSVVIYRRLHSALMHQRLPPGTRLPEEQLAEIFGVSRTLVRQALQRLAHDRLVVQEPNRGVKVAEPTIEEVRHLYEARRIIECAVLVDAKFRPTRAQIAALRRLVAQEATANARGDTQQSIRLSGKFHLDLVGALANPIIDETFRELIARGNVAIAFYEIQGRASCRCADHHRIVQRLAAGDTAEAIAILRRHLTDIEESLTQSRHPRRPVDLRALLGSESSTVASPND